MKSVRKRRNRRKALVKSVGESKVFNKTELNEDLINNTIKKVGLKGLSNIVNAKVGVDMISRQLDNKVSKKDISDLRQMLVEKSSVFDSSNPLLKKKFFYPFRGVWFFDILFNRKLRQNEDDNVLLQVGVFINGNSGFARTYEIDDKQKETITTIYQKFISDCRSLNVNGTTINYPCKKIISDDEPGVPQHLDGVEIVKIKQSGTDHRLLSKINSFASNLRKFNELNNPGEEYITEEILDEYVDLWNKKKLPFVGATRNEMMCDVSIEEAYISACMNENLDVKNAIDDAFKADDLVKIKETDEAFRHNPQVYGKEKRTTYRVISNKDGKLQLQNTNDPNDVRMAGMDMITRQVVSNRDNLNTYLAKNNLELPASSTSERSKTTTSQHVPLNRTVNQEEVNKSKAKAYSNTTTTRRARELLELEAGEKSMNYTPKQKINVNNLSQADISKLAKEYVEQKIKDDFNLGFLTDWTDESKYQRMEEFVKTMPDKFMEQFFGDVVFYQKRKTISKENIAKLSANLRKLLEDPEFRKVYDTPHSEDHKNIIANVLGRFIKNKTGPKQK